MWKLSKARPDSFLQLYSKSGTEIEDDCSLLSCHYAAILVFSCLNHVLWEADCVSKLNRPVVFHCLLAGHAAFLTVVQFLSLSLQLLGKGAIKSDSLQLSLQPQSWLEESSPEAGTFAPSTKQEHQPHQCLNCAGVLSAAHKLVSLAV